MLPHRATLTLHLGDAPSGLRATLRDANGANGHGPVAVDLSTLVPGLDRTWDDSLSALAHDPLKTPDLEQLGDALFRVLTTERSLAIAWASIRGAEGKAPLHLTVELPNDCPLAERLPWELLRDERGFVFHGVGSALCRTYAGLRRRAVQLSASPRVLLLWARPQGLPRFDPQPHIDALKAVFGERLEVLNDASVERLAAALRVAKDRCEPFEVVHILAHGYMNPVGDTEERGAVLCGSGGAEHVPGDQIASMLRGHGVRLVFLSTCQSALVESTLGLTGLAQRLLSTAGADVPVVIAAQANLPTTGSAKLAEHFYRALPQDRGDPALALSRARAWAYGQSRAWFVPILMRCPAPEHDPGVSPARDLGQLDDPRPTFRPRPEVLDEGLKALQSSRLVSVVGLPGIGKTEIGKEIARQALARGDVDRVLYLEAHRGLDGEAVRVKLWGFLGLNDPPKTDEALAATMERDPSRLLLVLDNAEDLMSDKARQAAFKAQLGAWLRGASRLRLLLTTRWPVSASDLRERRVDVPPLPRDEMDALLRDELTARGALREGEPGSAAWDKLLDLLDGHPRALILVAPQLAERGMTLPDVVRRLQRFKETAYADSDLIGQEDAWDGLETSELARIRSLVASMDLSWATLTDRYPTAALAYRELSLFPAGLPDEVARRVTQDDETLSLKRLTDLSLVERRAGRTFSPVPLHWYAEKKRLAEPVDEDVVFARAVDGFVGFVEECNSAFLRSDAVAQGRFFTECANLALLANCAPSPWMPGTAPFARLAESAQNLLMMLDQLRLWEKLASRGLNDARAVGDHAGEANTLYALGELYVRTARLSPAEDAYTQALQLFRHIEDSLGEAYTLQALGELYFRTARLDRAKGAYTQALQIFQRLEDSLGEANTLRALGELYLRTAGLASAEETYTQALVLYKREGSKLGEANTRKVLGDLYVRTSRLVPAEDAYTQALQLYNHVEDSLGEAYARKAIGDLYVRTARLDPAEDAYKLALQLFQRVEDSLGEANTLRALGGLYVRTARLDLAEDVYTQAFKLYKRVEDLLGEANTLHARGELFVRTNRLAPAEDAYTQALRLFKSVDSEVGEANTRKALGDLYVRTDRLAPAEDAYTHALQLYKHLKNSVGEANTLQAMGRLAHDQRRLSDALGLYSRARTLYRSVHERFGLSNVLAEETKCRALLGDVAGAAKSAQEALQIGQEIGNDYAVKVASAVLSKLNSPPDD